MVEVCEFGVSRRFVEDRRHYGSYISVNLLVCNRQLRNESLSNGILDKVQIKHHSYNWLRNKLRAQDEPKDQIGLYFDYLHELASCQQNTKLICVCQGYSKENNYKLYNKIIKTKSYKYSLTY